jgi:hypothetical protein
VIYPVFSADEADEANLFASTMTTRGDLLTMGSGPTVARLAVSSNSGYVLTSDGTDPVWGQVANAGVASGANITATKIAGTAVTLADTGTVTNTMLAGSIADTKLATIATAGKVSNSATTATSANTASAIVARDASGNFTAGTITATNVSAPNLPRGVVAYVREETGSMSLNSMGGGSIALNGTTTTFTPVAGRLYRCAYSIGSITQPVDPDALIINLLKGGSSTLDISNLFESTSNIVSHTRIVTLTSSQLGTSPTYLSLTAQTNTSVTVANSSTRPTIIIVEDIGPA